MAHPESLDERLPSLGNMPIIGILRRCPSDRIVEVAECAARSGLTTIEITFDSDDPTIQIRSILKAFPELTVGAGTILDTRQAKAAIAAGASLLVSPVVSAAVLSTCLELVFDRVAGEIELPEPDPDRWRDQFKNVMRQARRLMLHHRDIARISMGRIPVGPNAMRWTEWTLRLLRGAGFPDQVAAYAGDLLGLYVGAYAFEESLGLASPTGEDLPPGQILDMVRGYFASLPADRFPNITSMVDVLMAGDQEKRFEFGLEVLIAGLDAAAQRASDKGA